MGSAATPNNPAVGEWKNFTFRTIKEEDKPRVLQHMRDCFFYGALYRVGYTKDMDEEMSKTMEKVLSDEKCLSLSFLAEEKGTGKFAGLRIITIEKAGEEHTKLKNNMNDRICRNFMKFYFEMLVDCKIKEKYNVDEYPHHFGISVEPEFQRQGLAIEMYRRANLLLKERGYKVACVGFISPYSRAAGNRNGFIQLSKRYLTEALDEEGKMLNPDAKKEDYMDLGVFIIN